MNFFQKFFRLIFFEIQVMSVSADADADPFYFNFFLFSFVEPFLLGLLVLVFPIIHYLADRRFGDRSDFHQVQFPRFGDLDRFQNVHDAELRSIFIDYPGFGNANKLVDPGERRLAGNKSFYRSSSDMIELITYNLPLTTKLLSVVGCRLLVNYVEMARIELASKIVCLN